MSSIEILFALTVGLVGWYICQKLRLPGAAVVGPMLFVGAGAFFGAPTAIFPPWVKSLLQILVGIYGGAGITRKTINDIRAIGGSVAIVTAWTVLSAVLIGYLVAMLTRIDLATALLGCTPGGLDVMTAIALSVGADAAMVAVLHTFRLIATIGLVPVMARRGQTFVPALQLSTADGPSLPPSQASSARELAESHAAIVTATVPHGLAESASNGPSVKRSPQRNSTFNRLGWLPTVALAGFGGTALSMLGVQGGAVVGALLGVAIIGVINNRVKVPPVALRTGAQVALGVVLGASLTPDSIPLLVNSLPLVLIITVSTLVSALALAGFLQRAVKIDAVTSMLACAPGGFTQMPLIAAEVGADTTQVTVFQFARFLGSITLLPVLFRLLL